MELRSEFYGRLRAKDYSRLLSDFRGLRRGRLEIEGLAAAKGAKMAELLGEQGYTWWDFYELPYVHNLALFCTLMGWQNDLARIARDENPSISFLEFMDTKDGEADEDNPVMRMKKPDQAIVLNLILSLLYSTEALGYFSLTVSQLLSKARQGDRRAFLQAVSVDRMVIATSTGTQLIADAQIRKDKSFLSGIFKTVRAPHARRKTYVDLRVLHRLLEEAGALVERPASEVFDLVGAQLGVISPDSSKGLDDLFRLWKRDAGE